MTQVTFSFDPACPWTWRASRWLTEVANARDLKITWQPMSLHVLNEDKEIPEPYRSRGQASFRALRLVAALGDAGRQDAVSRFYTELGRRVHTDGHPIDTEQVQAAAVATGLSDERAALDDGQWDAAVREATQAAFHSAGPDVGSPVLQLPGVARGLHGPILTEVPEPDEALALWDSLVPLLRNDVFLEVKRGRPS